MNSSASGTAIHVPYVVPVQKMDTPTGLFAGRCRKCDYAGGPTSERDAYRDATQHADAKNAAENVIVCHQTLDNTS